VTHHAAFLGFVACLGACASNPNLPVSRWETFLEAAGEHHAPEAVQRLVAERTSALAGCGASVIEVECVGPPCIVRIALGSTQMPNDDVRKVEIQPDVECVLNVVNSVPARRFRYLAEHGSAGRLQLWAMPPSALSPEVFVPLEAHMADRLGRDPGPGRTWLRPAPN
jgi:hypothetical protein